MRIIFCHPTFATRKCSHHSIVFVYLHDGGDDLSDVSYVCEPFLCAFVWNATDDAVTGVDGGVHGCPSLSGDVTHFPIRDRHECYAEEWSCGGLSVHGGPGDGHSATPSD